MTLAGAEVESKIDYLVPSSRINRRFWAPGRELNTGVYAPYPVTIRNARLAGPFTLDAHGFCLARHRSAIGDWENQYAPGSAYAAEVAEVAKSLSGADLVIPLGGMLRDSAVTSPTVQPPAAEAHVDFTERCAERRAAALYRQAYPEASGYRRFIGFSLWRALSAPPQDMPLALCEGRSVRDEEGTHNTKVDVTEIPTGEALYAPIAGEEDMLAATIFHYSPGHRWWYFPDMEPDEVIFIKLYDSDHSKAWRCPHTAFRDTTRPDARPRRSMEFRAMAYFSNT
ncbi:MAG TPA: CmcJ/NvfI family oxidoreductase [Steroidobacteraceae bacterium]